MPLLGGCTKKSVFLLQTVTNCFPGINSIGFSAE
jgi:hypothetical protein